MKCLIRHEWWRLLLALVYLGFTIWNAIGGLTWWAVLFAMFTTYMIVTAFTEHMYDHLRQDMEDLQDKRLDALAEAFMFHPIEANMKSEGDKALITLTRNGQGERGYKVEYIPNDLVEADA